MTLRTALAALLTGSAALVFAGHPARAEEWAFLGPRYQAMGGAGVALANDSYASYWNPGALGIPHGYDFNALVGAQASAEGDILRDIDEIAEFIVDNDIESLIDDIQNGNPIAPDDLRDGLDLALNLIDNLGAPGQGFLASFNAALIGRWDRFSLGSVGIGHFGIDPVVDLENLSFNTSGTAGDQINNAFGAAPPPGAFSNPASQGLADALAAIFGGVAGVTDPQNAAESLVYQAEQAGVDTGDPNVQSLLDTIANATAGLGGGDLSENGTGAFVRGLATAESGLAAGFALPIPLTEGHVGIGANMKYMFGTTTLSFVRYDEISDAGDLLDTLTDRNNVKHTHTWGLDLGMVVEPIRWVRVGVVARNVNSPTFESKGPNDFTLDRQVRAGLAVRPFSNWVIALDVDLTENKSEVLPGFKSRLVSGGTEVTIPLGTVAALALRAGAYMNTASSAQNAVALTGGLGIRVAGFEFDLAAGASPDTTRLETGSSFKVPTRANLSAALRYTKVF